MARDQERTKKIQRRRNILIEFVSAAGLAVDPASIKKELPPKPHVTCRIKGELHFFHLQEITNKRLPRSLDDALRRVTTVGGAQSNAKPLLAAILGAAHWGEDFEIGEDPLELVLYYDKLYPPPDAATLAQKCIGVVASEMVSVGRWNHVWVFDRWTQRVLCEYVREGAG